MIDIKRYSKGPELDSKESMNDFFGIDDLLDFSGEEVGAAIGEAPCQTAAPLVGNVRETISSRSCHIEAMFESNRPPDICIPCDDIAELEWLSNFVEESFSSADTTLVRHHGQEEMVEKAKQEVKGSASPISVLESSEDCKQEAGDGGRNVVQGGRARRSKRARWGRGGGVCFWNTRVLWAYDDTCGAMLDYSSTSSGHESPKKQKQKKQKKKRREEEERRCMHCGIEKSPQWRGGPMGPKTLCNACGVRFKSGRLLPEYRPAASPTFVQSIHSNSHRKVLELHKQRTMPTQTDLSMM